jgi:ribose-phosphate pyrophosphokinase
MRNDNGIKIFAGTASREFAQKICNHLFVPLGESQVITFSEGNTYVKIGEKVRGNDVYIVQTIGIDPNNEFMELLFWIDAFNRASVNSVTVIMPYFSYAKADKKDEPRVSIRARVCADCLEAVGVSRVVTMDLHSPQIQGFFRKPVDHLYAANIFCDYIKALNLDNYVIVSPDEGFAKNAGYFSQALDVPLAVGNKRRSAHDEKAEILNLFGDVNGKTAVIVDDLTISCGTLKEIAATLKKNGAGTVIAFVSHAPISEAGIQTLMESDIETLYTTDTIYNPRVLNCPKVKIISVSELFAKTIKIIHEKDSLGELFL